MILERTEEHRKIEQLQEMEQMGRNDRKIAGGKMTGKDRMVETSRRKFGEK